MLIRPIFWYALPLLLYRSCDEPDHGWLTCAGAGVEPAEENVMRRPPYSSTESIFGRGAIRFIIVLGHNELIALGVGYASWRAGWEAGKPCFYHPDLFTTGAALSVRSEENSLFKNWGCFPTVDGMAVLSTLGLQLAVIYVPLAAHLFYQHYPGLNC